MELKLGYATPEAVRELFAEYTHMLVAHDPYFQASLDLQHYDAEVADPTQKYGLPDGRLYVAWCDGQPAGCIALRRLAGTTCELKRLYVRPAFRGRGIAGAMMQRHRLHGHAARHAAVSHERDQNVPRARVLRHPAVQRQPAGHDDLPAAGPVTLRKFDAPAACPAAGCVVS